MVTSYEFLQRGHYLAALAQTEREYKEASQQERFRIGQSLATFYSFCGDEAGVESSFPPHPNKEAPLPAGGTPEDARQRISKEARTRQIVILNEAHHRAHHRAFGLSLLADLRKQGFTHFAAETFRKPETLTASLKQRAVTREAGYYTHEPTFAAYVREALRLGFQLVPYEAENRDAPSDKVEDSINHRETQQAQNLQQRTFKSQPSAKVFIHVGYDHLIKQPVKLDSEILWMAGRLKQLLQLDPLTIDQAQGDGRLPRLPRPSVLRMPDGSSGASGNLRTADLYVFHPKAKYRNGRPDWLFALPGRRAIPIPSSLLPGSGRVLIQAFREGEPPDAVAWDRVLVTAGQPIPVLALPAGTYLISQQTETEITTLTERKYVS